MWQDEEMEVIANTRPSCIDRVPRASFFLLVETWKQEKDSEKFSDIKKIKL